MSGAGKNSAIADLASSLGSGEAHTRAVAENSLGLDGQADLLGFDDEIGQFADAAVRPPAVKRGAGRPAGSVNRTTLQLQRWLLAKGYRDPAEFLAAVVTMDARDLAAALAGVEAKHVTFKQASAVLKIQRSAAADLMPYFHQRKPQQVEHVGEGARPLIIIADGPRGGGAAGGDDQAMSVHDLQPDQWVTLARQAASHGQASHDSSQATDKPTETGHQTDD